MSRAPPPFMGKELGDQPTVGEEEEGPGEEEGGEEEKFEVFEDGFHESSSAFPGL